MTLPRRRFLYLAAGAATLPFMPSAARAETYPSRHMRFVVPFPPGGASDPVARVLAGRLSEVWGQQVIVENKGGAGGNIGALAAAQSAPDGYTIFIATNFIATNPFLYASLGYDPLTDLAPVTRLTNFTNVLLVPNSSSVASIKDFIAYAKANPGKINWANSGTGFQSHLAGVLFTHMANIDVLHVPYKGAGLSVPAVISGESHVTFGPAPAFMGHVQSGRLRALAIGSEKRSTLWPEIPTVIESGLPGYVSDGWAGIMAPKGTPKVILEKLNAALVSAVRDPATVEALKRIGAEPLIGSPADFTKLIAKEWKNLGDAIRISNLKVD